MLQRAMQKLETVYRWLEVGSGSAASAGLVRLMQRLFAAYFHVPEPEVARRNGLVYAMGFVNHHQRGRIEEMLFGGTEDPVSERVAVLATIEEPRALAVPVLEDLMSLASDTGAGLVALSCSTARVADRELIECLRALRKAGTEVLLFDWADLGLAVAAKTLAGTPQASMRRARASALQILNMEDERFIVEELDRPKWLANRALHSLKVVIGRLPKASTVFDLGSGCGRHTMLASASGHEVLAVDWKESICERLRGDLATLPPTSGKVTVLHADFIDVSAETFGLADLVICTGVLQHARDAGDLARRLTHLSNLAGQPAALIYIEMLFDMLFDGRPPTDGRAKITHAEFEGLLREIFPAPSWAVQRTFGPMRQTQSFDQGARSFEPPARTIESTAAEYLIRRLD
jgi:SAM-dependent methyltransferase